MITTEAWKKNIDDTLPKIEKLLKQGKEHLGEIGYPDVNIKGDSPKEMPLNLLPFFGYCQLIDTTITKLKKLREVTPASIDAAAIQAQQEKKRQKDAAAIQAQQETERQKKDELLGIEENWDDEVAAYEKENPEFNAVKFSSLVDTDADELKNAKEQYDDIAKLSAQLKKGLEFTQGKSQVTFSKVNEVPTLSAESEAQPPIQAVQPPIQAVQPPVQAVQPPVSPVMDYLKRKQVESKQKSQVSDTPDITSTNPKKPKH